MNKYRVVKMQDGRFKSEWRPFWWPFWFEIDMISRHRTKEQAIEACKIHKNPVVAYDDGK